MCTPLRHRLVPLVLGYAVAACAGDLTLPDSGSPESGSPAALEVVSGDAQEGTVGSRLNDPLIVRVTDASSRPLADVPVVFRFQSEFPEAEVDPTEAATNSEGLAIAEVRLGADAGSHVVEARVADGLALELRATFDIKAVDRGKGKKGKGGGDGDDDDEEEDD